jgi:hypothetical protein
LPASSVFQPFLTDLVASHVKLPDIFGNAFEVLRLVDEDIPRPVILISNIFGESFLNEAVTCEGIKSP